MSDEEVANVRAGSRARARAARAISRHGRRRARRADADGIDPLSSSRPRRSDTRRGASSCARACAGADAFRRLLLPELVVIATRCAATAIFGSARLENAGGRAVGGIEERRARLHLY